MKKRNQQQLQFERAYALALDFGHEWAQAAYAMTEDKGKAPPVSFAEADELHGQWLKKTAPCGLPAGIGAPLPDEGEPVDHVTGTGRTHWRIEADGTTAVEIHRPANPDVWESDDRGDYTALRAVVDPGGRVAVEELGPAEERHWDALHLALACVASRDAILTAALDIARAAMEDGGSE